jgi:hypothetical protein
MCYNKNFKWGCGFDKSRGSFHISNDIPQSKSNLLMNVIMQENHKKANYIIYFFT